MEELKKRIYDSLNETNLGIKNDLDKVFYMLEEYEKKIKIYEDYFEENSVDAIENKLEPYYEALAKLYDEEETPTK